MLIKRQEDVTDAVVDAFKNTADPRAAGNPHRAG